MSGLPTAAVSGSGVGGVLYRAWGALIMGGFFV
jgi:hypothetical protein